MSGPQTEEQWRWAEALAIDKAHGSRAALFVAERIGTLALAGDQAGVKRFTIIAACIQQILKQRRHGQ